MLDNILQEKKIEHACLIRQDTRLTKQVFPELWGCHYQ